MEKLETEINYIGTTWKELQEVAADRQAWCELVYVSMRNEKAEGGRERRMVI